MTGQESRGQPPQARDVRRRPRVASVHAFPLRSAGAPALPGILIDSAGIQTDRWFVVVDPAGRPVTAAQEPRLREVNAVMSSDGGLVLQIPGAPSAVRGQRADAELSRLLARPVRIVRASGDRGLDAPVHLVTRQAMERARSEPHRVADGELCPCSVEEPRANIVIDLPGPGPDGLEPGWIGRMLRVGPAMLRLSRQPDHCLGAYADVLVGGRVAPGDTVQLMPSAVPALPPTGKRPAAKPAQPAEQPDDEHPAAEKPAAEKPAAEKPATPAAKRPAKKPAKAKAGSEPDSTTDQATDPTPDPAPDPVADPVADPEERDSEPKVAIDPDATPPAGVGLRGRAATARR